MTSDFFFDLDLAEVVTSEFFFDLDLAEVVTSEFFFDLDLAEVMTSPRPTSARPRFFRGQPRASEDPDMNCQI